MRILGFIVALEMAVVRGDVTSVNGLHVARISLGKERGERRDLVLREIDRRGDDDPSHVFGIGWRRQGTGVPRGFLVRRDQGAQVDL